MRYRDLMEAEQPYTVRLKDGREITVNHLENFEDGLHCFEVFATLDGEMVGDGKYDVDRGEFRGIEVERSFRRLGIASAIYDYVEQLGYDVKPSPYLQPDGVALWTARYKRQNTSEGLAETIGAALREAVAIAWLKGSTDWSGEFHAPSGRWFRISIAKLLTEPGWAFEFAEMTATALWVSGRGDKPDMAQFDHKNPVGTLAPTGRGGKDAAAVFATLRQAMREFIEAEKPERIRFRGATGRQTQFYRTMLRHYKSELAALGYRASGATVVRKPVKEARQATLREARWKTPTVLYHCTLTKNLPSILDHGLDPKRSRSQAYQSIFLAGDLSKAEDYANDYHHSGEEGSYTILAIKLRALDKTLLEPDGDDLPDMLWDMGIHDRGAWKHYSWRQSLRITGQCSYAGVISPAAINVIKQIGDEDALTEDVEDEEADADYEERMARARSMGFDPDDDWFHGTAKPMTQFDASLLGSTTGARNTVLGFFFTNDEWQASAYAGRRGQVIDVLLRMRKPLLLKQGGDYVDVGDVGHFLDEYVRDYEQLPRYPTEEDYAEFRRALQGRGYDSIIVQLNPKHRVAVVFDANQIRDRDAQFDPAKVNSPHLLD